MDSELVLQIFPNEFSVIQVADLNQLTPEIEPIFIGKTDEELSVVLPTQNVPAKTIKREDHWALFKIDGVLDFSLIGILAKISGLLAQNSISIFVVSTYNTDYFLIKQSDVAAAKTIFSNNGYRII